MKIVRTYHAYKHHREGLTPIKDEFEVQIPEHLEPFVQLKRVDWGPRNPDTGKGFAFVQWHVDDSVENFGVHPLT